MKAGRELDSLIAEKVMEWTLSQATDTEEYWDNGSFCNGLWVKDWNPSTNISDAWIVVDKLDDMGFELERYKVFTVIPSRAVSNHKTEYRATFWNGSNNFSIEEESAPYAICLAALLAVGVEIES